MRSKCLSQRVSFPDNSPILVFFFHLAGYVPKTLQSEMVTSFGEALNQRMMHPQQQEPSKQRSYASVATSRHSVGVAGSRRRTPSPATVYAGSKCYDPPAAASLPRPPTEWLAASSSTSATAASAGKQISLFSQQVNTSRAFHSVHL